jgi:class 3 adenylate cyclase/tetratricopeptide (TPR) repeat protein
MTEREQLEGAIAALASQRAVLGDAVVDTALAALRNRLARLDTPEQQLKPVTVLFTDVVDSTRLSQRLDPEDIHAIMDTALQGFTSIVESERGRTLQYAGDSLLAVFGAPDAHEDDPERAVRAGLAILEEARRLAARVKERHGYGGFDVRVGIHTGPVLLGGGVDAEGNIRGITVNIAARIEQAAPTGGLRISHATYRHVRGMFEVSEQPPILVKGIPTPLRSYLVLRARPRTFETTNRGVDGVEAPLIGRDTELARLVAAFQAVLEQRRLSLLTLVGDAGLGKTRLTAEFERWLEAHSEAVWLFHARAQPSSANVPYGLLRALFGWRFGILDTDGQAVAHAKLAEGFGALFGDRTEEQIALIGQLIGLDYGASPYVAGLAGDGQLRDRAFHAATQYFRLLLREGSAPAVLLLDDLHWADEASLDFIEHLAQTCRDLPMLVLCLTRPTLDERRPRWGGAMSRHERIDLGPLSQRDSGELARSLLRRLEPVPAALSEMVTSHAEGNPYFIEELVAMLVDGGVIVADGERWQVAAERLVDAQIPSTLAGVLQARLDGLPPAEKMALRQASVIGHVFWDEPLRRVAPDVTQALDGLLRRDLVRAREPSSFDGAHEFAFKHHLLHQVTYDSVLKSDKRRLHRLTAEWLVARSGDRSSEFYGLIADHYDRATDTASAAAYWYKAAEVAWRMFATDAALSYLNRTLDLTPLGEPGRRCDVLTRRIDVLNLTRRRREEEDQICELERVAESMKDDARRADAAVRRARLGVFTGDNRAAASAAERALTLAEKSSQARTALLARSVWASAALALGDYVRAQVLADDLFRTARALGDRPRTIDALHLRGSLAVHEGRYGAAREYFEQALQIARAIPEKVFESVQLHNLGNVERALGNYAIATGHHETGLQISRDVGAAKFVIHFLGELAELANVRGDAEAALNFVAEGLTIGPDIDNHDLEACVIVIQGNAQAALGQWVNARESYHRALEIYREVGRTGMRLEPFAFAGLARVAAALGDDTEALAHVAQIEAEIDAGYDPNSAAELLWACYEVLEAVRSPRAKDILARAHLVLMERASLLDAEDRATFLGNVPSHRAILTTWPKVHGAPAG